MNSLDITTALPDEPRPRHRPRGAQVWAGAVLLLGGLMLIFLGGCFLIGALLIALPGIVNPCPDPGAPPPTAAWQPEEVFLFVVLNGLSLACFISALVLMLLGVRGLLRILAWKPED
jgi:hypothetical protein